MMIRVSLSFLFFPLLVGSFTFPSIASSSLLQNRIRTTTTSDYTYNWKLCGTREDEIRRKITNLRNQGKIKKGTNAPAAETALDRITQSRENRADQYNDRISEKLGSKEQLFDKLGQDDDDDTPEEYELDDEELDILEAVERALDAKRARNAAAADSVPKKKIVDEMEELAVQMEEEQRAKLNQSEQGFGNNKSDETVDLKQTTSGIGGTWAKNETIESETYRPANGGWGYFPRPKDISQAYGGGKKIGADVQTTFADELRKQKAVEDTREKIRNYREKVGIEVQSEKDHAKEIEEALLLGQRAMQRGVYGTAVSILEKVTKWCSTNSKVGGQIFLELGMAYEAVGRTSEAIQVYTSLTTSRMEDVKYNAKKLLCGIEAMQFMRNEAKSDAFARKKASQTFIDTTGLGNIAQNFDDVYNTAYIDLDRKGGYYRKLTENVVRSIREARQILLSATDSSEIDRTKVVQALRSIDRSFSDALRKEIKKNTPKPKSEAVINGVPIIRTDEEVIPGVPDLESFNIGEIDTVLENIAGAWKLQLMADSKGDGVNFYNKTLCWQEFDVEEMNYKAFGPSGFLSLSQSGAFDVNGEQRIISRKEVEKEGSASFFHRCVLQKVIRTNCCC